MFNIAICDDERYFRDEIKEIVKNCMECRGVLYKIDTFNSGESFLKLRNDLKKYQLIFLDIKMRRLDGIVTAQKIREISKDIIIVFLTAYCEHVYDGYTVNAFRYILKKQENCAATIARTIDDIYNELNYQAVQKSFKFRENYKTISLDRLIMVNSHLHYLTFHVLDETVIKYTMYGKLNTIEAELAGYNFVRVHQSYLVNMSYIKDLNRSKARLRYDIEASVSTSRYMEAMDMFVAFKGKI